MALSKVLGYQILLDLNGSKIAGTTQDTFTLSPLTEETIMKSDNGVKQLDLIGHEGKFSVNAYVIKTADAGFLDVADVMNACTDNDTSTFTLNFGTAVGNAKVTGTAKFLNFSINSDSESYADMSIELETVGTVWVGAITS